MAIAAGAAACGDDTGSGAEDAACGCGDDPDAGGREDAGDPEPPEFSTSPAVLPEVTGECPGFEVGAGCTQSGSSLLCTFNPAGIEPRQVYVWIGDEAREQDGPLVVYWHGLSGSGSNAAFSGAGLGPDVIAEIVASGGIVVGPERSEKRQTTSFSELPWLLALGSGDEDDLLVLDEVIACAEAEVGIDRARIHITGMSAGGLQSGQVNPRRSSYVASAAVFSGGQLGTPPIEDAENLYPVMLLHGGPSDMVVLNFKNMQEEYYARLKQEGHFAVLCDHGQGHSVPVTAADAAWEFLKAHPKGGTPESWADALPDTLPDYCSRP